jgi:hypothetical protein
MNHSLSGDALGVSPLFWIIQLLTVVDAATPFTAADAATPFTAADAATQFWNGTACTRGEAAGIRRLDEI